MTFSIFFPTQVPVDSDDSDNEEGGGASGRGSDEAGSEQVSDNELSGDDPGEIGKSDEPMQESPDEDLYGDEDLAESEDQSDEDSSCEFEDTVESLEQSAHNQTEDDL